MKRSGFALLAVLWVLTALTVLSGVAVGVARLGSLTTRNRILLGRADWAREGCVEILFARYAEDPTVRKLDDVDLGRGTWCGARLEDPGAKLNPNVADPAALVAILSAVSERTAIVVDSLVDALLHWRDADTLARRLGLQPFADRNGSLADVTELRFVRGFDDTLVARLGAVLTTRGRGTINLNVAPLAVLATVPGLSNEAVQVLVRRRMTGRPVQSADELAGLLSSSARAMLHASYQEFLRRVSFTPLQLVAVVEGGVRGTPLVARVTLTAVPVPGRLAIVRRETE